ncbi:16S rRNA (guanine(966)-N(2))-methyltransferase RsmD [Pseudomaricurvus sp. HS19]|uniref:16S rRNA (guanine(966)-N(2))-methyltransferase RsmD n=1 Tax=Pseudomaricurvus sp. HS19 TaxID=2692626 RepID=UPI0019282153|nr:16S rRNA (guanine(966)-N(2))-methyltransferase RsmD [Pseudomaricurvus sp. HS19]
MKHSSRARRPSAKPAPRQPSSTLRIIGGEWRGRKLQFSAAEGLRPTGDRVRETLFNWLMPSLHGARCLDLFAGSGALGLEALSRGAAHVTFLDNHAPSARQIEAHLQLLGCDRGRALQADTLQWLQQTPAEACDIVFVDPPFQLDLWPSCLQQLETGGWLGDEALIYVETPRAYPLSAPTGWEQLREKQAGEVCFRLFCRATTLE